MNDGGRGGRDSPEDVGAVHEAMLSAVKKPLSVKIFRDVLRGWRASQLFAVVQDLGDEVWREHVNFSATPSPLVRQIGSRPTSLHIGVYSRDNLQHFITLLPGLEPHLTAPQKVGELLVLVLGRGMATPMVLHWGAVCEVEMDD